MGCIKASREPSATTTNTTARNGIMNTSEAMVMLGMNWTNIDYASNVYRIWKKRVMQVHREECLQKGGEGESLEHATKMTQRLNEARDVLLERVNDDLAERVIIAKFKRQQAKQEAILEQYENGEKQAAEVVAEFDMMQVEVEKTLAEKAAESTARLVRLRLISLHDLVHVESNIAEKVAERKQQEKEDNERKEARRAEYEPRRAVMYADAEKRRVERAATFGANMKLPKKNKCSPTVRMTHKAREFLEEMQNFFKYNFMHSPSNKLLVGDLLELFIEARPLSDLEKNLFKLHSPRLFRAAWPNADHSTYKNQRCWLNVSEK